MRRLKVLQLGGQGQLYGAERWILALARNLDPSQVESHIAAIKDEDELPVALLDEAARLGFPAHVITAPGRFNPSAILQLRRVIQDYGINVIHSHGYKADVLALLAAINTGCKTLSTPHGWSRDAGWKLRMYERLDQAIFRWFDAVSPLSAELMQGLSGNLALIPNGVDLLEIDEAGDPPQVLQKLRKRGPVIGYAGQLIARKDLSTLIAGFAQWDRRDASLVIVGEGDQRAELEALAIQTGIGAQVHFAGFRPDRLEWMRGFDLFVLPSLEEGIPRCLMEAMALGVPVLASDIPGNRELAQHGECALLFPPGDAAALVKALELALKPSQRAVAARENIEAGYSASRMARDYQALFARIVGN
jgi:glycosyltransferase involved in cell wall biosynthesis